jgi:sulfatase maturation enzyme AslB (radical SAM superfamily)
VRVREEKFGAIVYIQRRDRFFALDKRHSRVVRLMTTSPMLVPPDDKDIVVSLAEHGICQTVPPTPPKVLYGRSEIGQFIHRPVTERPLVINCFATTVCPLRCAYCHADDLMTKFAGPARPAWDERVLKVARVAPAMVGVVTGGEPLSRPDQAKRLIEALAVNKSVVLDSSGVGELDPILPELLRNSVHLRISMDSADAAVNDRLRPVRRSGVPLGTSGHRQATTTIEAAVGAGLACSVQSVIATHNCDIDGLLRLRDHIIKLGVQTWVLHTLVSAGKAARGNTHSRLVGGMDQIEMLDRVVLRSKADLSPLDIRVTSAHRTPNSVLLLGVNGDLSVESEGSGKLAFALPKRPGARDVQRFFAKRVSLEGHSGRYLNGSLND